MDVNVIISTIFLLMALALYVVGVILALRDAFGKRSSADQESLDQIKDTVEAITKLIEAIGKLSTGIQFVLFGSGCAAAGFYILSVKPF